MGAVYEATNLSINRRVAVKTIHPEKAVRPEAIDRFRREAHVMAAIESEHVAAILDAGEDAEANTAYLVMELLTGEDLAQVLLRAPVLPPQTALRIAVQTLEGLRAAHEVGIAHRDIKPSNIFLVRRRDGTRSVKLVDFGIARSLTSDETPASKKVTKTGSVVGTPPYMSPEQLANAPALDPRTDLWSLGVVLFEMLSGANPYQRATDLPQMLAWICFRPPPVLRQEAPWVPVELAALVQRSMMQSPDMRYAGAAEMIAACRRLLNEPAEIADSMLVTLPPEQRVPVVDRTVPFTAASARIAAPVRSSQQDRGHRGAPTPENRPNRRPLFLFGGILLAGTAGAFAAFYLMSMPSVSVNDPSPALSEPPPEAMPPPKAMPPPVVTQALTARPAISATAAVGEPTTNAFPYAPAGSAMPSSDPGQASSPRGTAAVGSAAPARKPAAATPKPTGSEPFGTGNK
jgi:eukaryotic-like serine/threonine-protein kinase